MRDKTKLIGYYNYTVILTYIGMLFGFTGIISAFENRIGKAVIHLMIAGVCDMFDGTIASTMKRTGPEKNFGIQIDSLSDLVCFGILPAVIVWRLNDPSRVTAGIASLYALCALIRLAYYNVDELERQKTTDAAREYYCGLPVTLSALFIPLLFWAASFFSFRPGRAAAAVLAVMALLFLTPFRLRKPKLK